MKKIITAVLLCIITTITYAHPGIGIVKDKKGSIFFTDLSNVWKISPDGKRTVVVPNVHTHELYMDSAGNLFGEHLWSNGDAGSTWGHYVWELKNDGTLLKVEGPKEGFLENYSFVRDDAGNMYWVERFKVSRIKKKSPDGIITTLAEGRWGEVRWMYATASGNVYFTNWYNLYKADTAGNVTLMANDIDRTSAEYAHDDDDRHNLYGIWTDKSENIYVAVRSGQMIKKISPGGEISVALQTTTPWTPTGGVFDNEGILWVLETNDKNEVRVRKVTSKELAGAVKPTGWRLSRSIFPFTAAGLVVIAFIWAAFRFICRKKIRAVETALKPLINNL